MGQCGMDVAVTFLETAKIGHYIHAHIYTHTHAQRERERERESNLIIYLPFLLQHASTK